MPTISTKTKTLVMPDMTDKFGPGGNPPDGYVVTYVASDGYYVAKPPSKLLVMSTTSTTPYTPGNEDVTLISHAGVFVVNLPTTPQIGQSLFIKDFTGNAATNNITINSAANIDGSASYTISTNFGSVRVVFTGATWAILAKF